MARTTTFIFLYEKEKQKLERQYSAKRPRRHEQTNITHAGRHKEKFIFEKKIGNLIEMEPFGVHRKRCVIMSL